MHAQTLNKLFPPALGAVLTLPWFLLHLLDIAVGGGRVVLGHVEALVDAAGNGLDVGHQLILNGLQVEAVVRRDQVNGQAQVSEPPCGDGKILLSQAKDDVHIF